MNFLKWLGLPLGLLLLGISLSQGAVNSALKECPIPALLAISAGFFLVYFAPARAQITKFTRFVQTGSWRSFYTGVFLLGVLFYSAVAWGVFDGIPHLDDDVSAVFQAKIFSSGRWTLPIPDCGEFFWLYCNIDARHELGHFCSMYPPGHPAMLVPGVLIRAPWLITPLFGGGLVVLIGALARQLYGWRAGRMAGLLGLFSPFLALLSGTHLSHVPTAFFLTLCMWSVIRLLRTKRWIFGLIAGFGFGLAFLHRPLTALTVGALIGLAPLWYWRRSIRCWKGILAALLLAILAAGALAAYQQLITGDFRTAGHEIGMGRRGKFGFVKLDWARTHTPKIGAHYTALRMRALNEKVLGWPIPMYLVVLCPFLVCRARKEDAWLLLPSLGLLAVYMAFWYYEEYYPARYIFSGVPMLIVLAARGYTCFESALQRFMRRPRLRHLPSALLTACVCFQLLVFIPVYIERFESHHGDVESVLPKIIRDYNISNALVFMDAVGLEQDQMDKANDYYATGFLRNSLDLDGDIAFARNMNEENPRLARLYPDRNYFVYRYLRDRNKAYLYRIEFRGDEQFATPIEPRTRHLLPPPLSIEK